MSDYSEDGRQSSSRRGTRRNSNLGGRDSPRHMDTTSSSHRRDDGKERRDHDRRYRDGDERRRRSRDRDEDHRRERRHRDRSRSRERHTTRHRSRSPPAKRSRPSQDRSRSPPRRSRGPLPSQDESFHGTEPLLDADGKPIVKEKPNYKPTGLLAKEANTVAGTTTVLKYHEPPEARKPPPREPWRMYVFKKKDLLDTVYLHQRSVWLMGRDEKVTDMLLEHPSISKQHAVIQFRYITTTNEFGDKLSKVKPYLIDLDSANGTKLNGKRIEASRFVELVDGDVVAFGDSDREYVLMLPPPDKAK